MGYRVRERLYTDVHLYLAPGRRYALPMPPSRRASSDFRRGIGRSAKPNQRPGVWIYCEHHRQRGDIYRRLFSRL